MSRSLEERFGICGYQVDGAVLRNGTKLTRLRIHKQRSDEMYDLIDPRTMQIYSNLIITGYDTSGDILDFSKENTALLDDIHVDRFFVRGYAQNPDTDFKGFVTKFLYNKVILSTGRTLYNMYTPVCPIYYGAIDNIIMNTIYVTDTSLSGILFDASGPIDPTNMVVTFTTPGGAEFSTSTVVNGQFTISPVTIDSTGTGTITVTSEYYDTKVVPAVVLPITEDSDYVTSILLSNLVAQGDGSYMAVIPETVHNRGVNLVVQIQEDASLIFCEVTVVDGDITVKKNDNTPVTVLIIGETNFSSTYKKTFISTDWIQDGDYYTLYIPSSQHLKANAVVSVYEENKLVQTEVQIDNADNITLRSNVQLTGYLVIAGKL